MAISQLLYMVSGLLQLDHFMFIDVSQMEFKLNLILSFNSSEHSSSSSKKLFINILVLVYVYFLDWKLTNWFSTTRQEALESFSFGRRAQWMPECSRPGTSVCYGKPFFPNVSGHTDDNKWGGGRPLLHKFWLAVLLCLVWLALSEIIDHVDSKPSSMFCHLIIGKREKVNGMLVRFLCFPLQLQASAKNYLPFPYHLDYYESHNPNSNISIF